MSRKGRSLRRRTADLEKQTGSPDGEDAVSEIHFVQQVAESAGGGKKVWVKPVSAATGAPDRYYLAPPGAEEGEEKALAKEEYEALPPARHVLPERHSHHQPRSQR